MPNEAKERFMRRVQDTATLIARIRNECQDLLETAQARGYQDGGANEIQDADILSTGLVAADAFAALYLVENVGKFLANQSPASADYRPIVATLRTDM